MSVFLQARGRVPSACGITAPLQGPASPRVGELRAGAQPSAFSPGHVHSTPSSPLLAGGASQGGCFSRRGESVLQGAFYSGGGGGFGGAASPTLPDQSSILLCLFFLTDSEILLLNSAATTLAHTVPRNSLEDVGSGPLGFVPTVTAAVSVW